MKAMTAKYVSKALESSARFFVSVMKISLHSPEAPQELRK